MRQALVCLPLAVLFLAIVAPLQAQSTEAATAAEGERFVTPAEDDVVYYDVGRNTSLRCTLPNPDKQPVTWKKNGTAVEALPELSARLALGEGGALLALGGRSLEDDFGNYTCSVGGAEQTWRLHGRVYTRLASANTNVVEGQKLKLVCRVVGKPAPAVAWLYRNASAAEGADAAEALGAGRVTLGASDAGVAGAQLTLEAARRSDAGRYTCVPLAPAGARSELEAGSTELRVKDMYAALWPFLGICAEVLVLCAVILLYERRRTKPELDDSDTDNHDQKKS